MIIQELDPLHNEWDLDAGLHEQGDKINKSSKICVHDIVRNNELYIIIFFFFYNSQARNLSFTSKTTDVGETSYVTSSEVICCSDIDDTELELISGPVGKSTEKGKPIHKKLSAKTEKNTEIPNSNLKCY